MSNRIHVDGDGVIKADVGQYRLAKNGDGEVCVLFSFDRDALARGDMAAESVVDVTPDQDLLKRVLSKPDGLSELVGVHQKAVRDALDWGVLVREKERGNVILSSSKVSYGIYGHKGGHEVHFFESNVYGDAGKAPASRPGTLTAARHGTKLGSFPTLAEAERFVEEDFAGRAHRMLAGKDEHTPLEKIMSPAGAVYVLDGVAKTAAAAGGLAVVAAGGAVLLTALKVAAGGSLGIVGGMMGTMATWKVGSTLFEAGKGAVKGAGEAAKAERVSEGDLSAAMEASRPKRGLTMVDADGLKGMGLKIPQDRSLLDRGSDPRETMFASLKDGGLSEAREALGFHRQTTKADGSFIRYDAAGKVHCDNAPAVKDAAGNEFWFEHGTRLQGPKLSAEGPRI
jgi:hypothetical protein